MQTGAASHSMKIQSLGICVEAQKRRENTTVEHSGSFPQSRLDTSSPRCREGQLPAEERMGLEAECVFAGTKMHYLYFLREQTKQNPREIPKGGINCLAPA